MTKTPTALVGQILISNGMISCVFNESLVQSSAIKLREH